MADPGRVQATTGENHHRRLCASQERLKRTAGKATKENIVFFVVLVMSVFANIYGENFLVNPDALIIEGISLVHNDTYMDDVTVALTSTWHRSTRYLHDISMMS